jgi:uncharacterized protein (DUF1330 family)
VSDAQKKAEQYLKEQAQIIQKYGAKPKLRGPKYKAVVSDTMRTFACLSNSGAADSK